MNGEVPVQSKHDSAAAKVDWKIFAVCLFAIAASYLIASIPFAQAAQVTISYGSSSMAASYSPESYVSKRISVDGATGDVRIEVSNGSANSIDAVYIYKCRGMEPSACSSQVSPVSLSGNIDATYHWNDVSDGSAYPQTANILLIAHTSDAGGGRWLAFWSQGKKNSGQPYTMLDSGISSISIAAKSVDYVPLIKSFIDTKGMLPMNAAWVAGMVFTGALGFYALEASEPPATTNRTYFTGNSLDNITGNKAFIFPYDGAKTLNGITLSRTPNYVTGDGICSPDESASSDVLKCLDCGSPSGYYCDISKGNKQLSSITLSAYSSAGVKVSNCNVQNTVSISFIISNQPTGTTITSAQYSLNGSTTFQASPCSNAGGNIYVCNITAPAVPGCSGADYALNPNNMIFAIRFSNASGYITKTLQAAPFPAITVGSWKLGDSVCESGLGENQMNSCYDCGCAAGWYCDIAAGRPETGTCKAPVSSSNLRVAAMDPSSLYAHNNLTGDNVLAALQITNAPQSVAVSSSGCAVRECLKSGLPCAANCSITCERAASINPDIYNSSCIVNFRIANYDTRQNYSIYTKISQSVAYSNGTGKAVSGSLETDAPTITIGSHWKGDGKCDPDESYATACFDCPCPSGQYCSTSNLSVFSAGDMCKPLGAINISVGRFYPAAFSDSMFQHEIGFSLAADSMPPGARIEPACSFAWGNVTCSVSCTAINATGGASCSIIVPSMDYKASPYYSSAARLITLGGNVLNISVGFRDGRAEASKLFSFAMPDVTIEPTFHCGNNECEANLNESRENCCIDCACAGTEEYCYTGTDLAGRCLNRNEIYLVHEGFQKRIACTIAELKGECIFVEPLDINVHVVKPPSGMAILSSTITMGNKSADIPCIRKDGQNYTCFTVLENIKDHSEGKTAIGAELAFTISYRMNNSIRTQNISTAFAINVNREESDYVKTCNAQLNDLDKKISGLKKWTTAIRWMLYVLGIAAIGFGIGCGLGCHKCCIIAVYIACILACASAVMLSFLGNMESQLAALKAQRAATCNANNFAQIESSNTMSSQITTIILSAIGGVVCVICLLNKFGPAGPAGGGGGGTATATSGASGGYLAGTPYASTGAGVGAGSAAGGPIGAGSLVPPTSGVGFSGADSAADAGLAGAGDGWFWRI